MDEAALCSSDFLEEFVWASYILYSTESDAGMSKVEKEQELEYDFQEEMLEFDTLYPYLEYSVEDETGELVTESVVDSGKKSLSSYGLAMTIRYDENGIPEAKIQSGEYRSGQIRELRSVLNEFSRRIQERYEYSDRESSDVYMKTPKNRTFTFAMTERETPKPRITIPNRTIKRLWGYEPAGMKDTAHIPRSVNQPNKKDRGICSS